MTLIKDFEFICYGCGRESPLHVPKQEQQVTVAWFLKKCNICNKRLWEAWKIKREGKGENWQIRCYDHLEL
jgi:hypothetical protein